MSVYLEAVVTLLPADAGGRINSIAPRDGSYRPFVLSAGGDRLRIRIIEGPPSIPPGGDGRVVVEVETPIRDTASFIAGTELDLVEHDRCVGILTVSRLCRAVPA